MHLHLVAGKVRVVSCANQGVNANRFTLDQLGFKSLNGQSLQSRRAIEQNRMTFSYFIKYVPDLRRLTFDHLLRTAHGVYVAQVFQPANDERLKSTSAIFFGNPH